MLTKKDLSEIKDLIVSETGTIKTEIKSLKSDIKSIKLDTRKINKKVDFVINYFDRDLIGEKKRTDKIVEHLGLPRKFGYE